MYKTSTSKAKSPHNGHVNQSLYADLDKIKNAFTDTAVDLKDRTGELISQSVHSIKHSSNKLQHNVAHYTAEKPFKSLGVAFLIGIGMGYFFRRK